MPEAQPQTEAKVYDDFNSIVLTIDHLAETAHPEGHQVHKFVCSTQSLTESMIALLNYYDLSAILQHPSTIETFQQAAAPIGLPVFVLHTAQNTQVVCDVDTWAVLTAQYGSSVLRATEALVDMVGFQLHTQIEAQGAASTLSLLMLSAQDPDAPMEPVQEQAPARRQAKPQGTVDSKRRAKQPA